MVYIDPYFRTHVRICQGFIPQKTPAFLPFTLSLSQMLRYFTSHGYSEAQIVLRLLAVMSQIGGLARLYTQTEQSKELSG